jgi:hypothetical protein
MVSEIIMQPNSEWLGTLLLAGFDEGGVVLDRRCEFVAPVRKQDQARIKFGLC